METNKLQELKQTARNILVYNRLQILNQHPFIGNIAMNLDLIPIRDARCSTAMTDGKTIYFDIDFLSKLSQNEIQFVLGHEIWHNVMLHFARLENRDMQLFNVATDMEVNQILYADGFVPPADAIFPNTSFSKKCQYSFESGLSAEEYYDLLINEQAKQMQNTQFDEQNSNSSQMSSSSNSSSNTSNSTSAKNHKQEPSKCGGQFDKHFNKNEDQKQALEDAMKAGASDKYGLKGEDEEFQPTEIKSDSDMRELTEQVREMVISSAQSYERFRGELPGYVKKYVDKLLNSKLPWKELLAAFITTGVQNKTNWNSPNRRFAYNGTYLPRHDGDMMRIAVGIDTSGSCQQDCQRFLTELNAIAKNFDSYELHVLQCDTEIKDYTMYDENNPLDPANPIEFKGFGGTKLLPIFDYISLNNLDVDAAVIFTDGYCEEFLNDGRIDIPVMWMLTNDKTHDNLQIGNQVSIEE